MKYISVCTAALFLVSCGQPTTGATPVDNVQAVHALCQVSSGAVVVVCVDYSLDSQANYADCTTSEVSNFSTHGANSPQYVGVGGTAITSCASQESSLTRVGSCLFAALDIRYYSSAWTTAAAQADCSARAGAWSTP